MADPTGHRDSVQMTADRVGAVYCGNARHGWGFAVAHAYRKSSDVTDEQVIAILRQVKQT